MRIAQFFACICFFTGSVSAQLRKAEIDHSLVPDSHGHYIEEFVFDKTAEPERWAKQKHGLNVSFATTNALFLRSEVPTLEREVLVWNSAGWRGERLSKQVLIWSPDTLSQVRFKVGDLKNSKGQLIDKKSIDVHLVRYVLSNYPYGASKTTCDIGASDTAYLMPDRFEQFDRFDLPGNTVRPVWVSLQLPDNIEAGVYNGTIEVFSEKEHKTLNLSIRVQGQLLPKPEDWKYRLDLWQNPWVVATYYQLEPWSPEHKALLKKHLRLYADAGGKYITTYAVHSPWSDNSYMIEGGMIEWIKAKDGSWKFSYDIFDQYVQLAMDEGIDEAITIYTPIPWGNRFRYKDDVTGNYINEEWTPESTTFRSVWGFFLDDLRRHLEMKGWLQKTYLGINENPMDQTMAAIKVIQEHSKKFPAGKGWKITYAGDWHPELTNLLDDYSPIISSEPSQKDIHDRKTKGFTTTYYVCCTPPKPNNFVFSPPVEGTYISWYAAAYGYDGFLRWAYDAWPADPLRDARHVVWPAGDCFLVYPGGASSIRYEKLREGIVDFEKIRLLRELVAKSTDKEAKNLMKDFEKHLTTFIGDRDYSKRDYNVVKMEEAVTRGKQILDEISDRLAR